MQGGPMDGTYSPADYRQQLIDLYDRHDPEKLGKVDELLQRFAGHEEALLRTIERKYAERTPSRDTNHYAAQRGRSSESQPSQEREAPQHSPAPHTTAADEPNGMNASLASSATRRGSAPRSSSYHARLTRLYEAHSPLRVSRVDHELEKYRGREEELIQAAVARFGPEPPAAAATTPLTIPAFSPSEMSEITIATSASPNSSIFAASPLGDYRSRAVDLYRRYDPSKTHKVDAQLAKFKGKEEGFLRALEKKLREGVNGTAAAASEASAALGGAAAATSPPPSVEVSAVQEDRSAAPVTDYARRLVRIYERYAPDRAHRAARQLQRYPGREEEVIQAAVEKYGPEPHDEAAAPVHEEGGGAAALAPTVDDGEASSNPGAEQILEDARAKAEEEAAAVQARAAQEAAVAQAKAAEEEAAEQTKAAERKAAVARAKAEQEAAAQARAEQEAAAQAEQEAAAQAKAVEQEAAAAQGKAEAVAAAQAKAAEEAAAQAVREAAAAAQAKAAEEEAVEQAKAAEREAAARAEAVEAAAAAAAQAEQEAAAEAQREAAVRAKAEEEAAAQARAAQEAATAQVRAEKEAAAARAKAAEEEAAAQAKAAQEAAAQVKADEEAAAAQSEREAAAAAQTRVEEQESAAPKKAEEAAVIQANVQEGETAGAQAELPEEGAEALARERQPSEEASAEAPPTADGGDAGADASREVAAVSLFPSSRPPSMCTPTKSTVVAASSSSASVVERRDDPPYAAAVAVHACIAHTPLFPLTLHDFFRVLGTATPAAGREVICTRVAAILLRALDPEFGPFADLVQRAEASSLAEDDEPWVTEEEMQGRVVQWCTHEAERSRRVHEERAAKAVHAAVRRMCNFVKACRLSVVRLQQTPAPLSAGFWVHRSIQPRVVQRWSRCWAKVSAEKDALCLYAPGTVRQDLHISFARVVQCCRDGRAVGAPPLFARNGLQFQLTNGSPPLLVVVCPESPQVCEGLLACFRAWSGAAPRSADGASAENTVVQPTGASLLSAASHRSDGAPRGGAGAVCVWAYDGAVGGYERQEWVVEAEALHMTPAARGAVESLSVTDITSVVAEVELPVAPPLRSTCGFMLCRRSGASLFAFTEHPQERARVLERVYQAQLLVQLRAAE